MVDRPALASGNWGSGGNCLGLYYRLPNALDVFPEFAPPQVEIQTEAPGLAPEEVETLITLPIESAINGTPGITTVRSASAVGLSVVKVIFGWSTDIYQARQLVTERLQQAASRLPEGVEVPQISPISSPHWHDFAICLDDRRGWENYA